jgi:glycosyltransferase involved in cell wall biosynthesis
MTSSDKTVLLFFKDFERDTFVRGDRHLKRAARPILTRVRKRHSTSGFRVWFERLALALSGQGYDVVVNDHRRARRNPSMPVGLVGYPHLLDHWGLPNPAVLGPCLYDHPEQAPHLLDDPRFRTYLLTCDWMVDLFAVHYPRERLGMWYAGLDLQQWRDTKRDAKTIDVLVYDKIRFDRDVVVDALLTPTLARLDALGLRYEIVRYGNYNYAAYRDLLQQSRSMLFLCEHETQGMAYQEAMAMNVPILAWQPGWWRDPARHSFQQSEVPAQSVPYFSSQCGDIFQDFTELDAKLEGFLDHVDTFTPREYVRQHLSLAGSAAAYLRYYDQLR